jgi:radical SAM protein with 4Fe4S-binding SPASM domain
VSLRPAAPAYVQLYPTLRCNLACSFCFNRGLAAVEDLSPGDFERILDVLAAAGVGTVDLLGGEPTLHPHLAELLAALARRGMRTTVSTGGGGDLGPLERAGEPGDGAPVRVGVSVNSASVPGLLRDFIARRRPMVKSVCTRDWRVTTVVEEHLRRPGAEFFLLFMDALAPDDLRAALTFPEYAARLRAAQREHPAVRGVFCAGFIDDPAGTPLPVGVRCPAGTTKLSVLPDGSVYPCYLLFRRPEFRLGNLLTDPFEAIWSHPALEVFRTGRGSACPRRECPYHGKCRGGCPAASLLVAGDLAAPDPRCVRPFADGGASSAAG